MRYSCTNTYTNHAINRKKIFRIIRTVFFSDLALVDDTRSLRRNLTSNFNLRERMKLLQVVYLVFRAKAFHPKRD